MAYPDFLCIGARKSGTTWLQYNLRRSPGVWLPPQKELHYFDHAPPSLFQRLFARTAHLRRARARLRKTTLSLGRGSRLADLEWAARVSLAPRNATWYGSLFPDDDTLVKGEICPGYARMSQERIAAVSDLMPRVKLVYLLRDPIECAWSSATSHFAKKEGRMGVEKAPAARIEAYLSSDHAVSHLRYAENLRNWQKIFPGEQIFVTFFDDLQSDPRGTFGRILRFLDLDDSEERIPANIDRKRGGRVRNRAEVPTRYRRLLARLYIDSLVELDAALGTEQTARWLVTASAALQAEQGRSIELPPVGRA